MKKLLSITLLLSATILSGSIEELCISDNLSELSISSQIFKKNNESHKKAVACSSCHHIKAKQNNQRQQALKLVNIKKQEAFHTSYTAALQEHDPAAATIIAKKQAQKVYNSEYKRAQKSKPLEIIIPANLTNADLHTDLKRIVFIYNNDNTSPMHEQFPDFFSTNNHDIDA